MFFRETDFIAWSFRLNVASLSQFQLPSEKGCRCLPCFFLEDIVGISPAESFKPLIFFGDFNLLSTLGHWVLNDSMSTVKYEMETRFENSWGQHAWQVKSFWRSSELANVMSGSIYIYIYTKILIAQKYASSFSRQFLESNLKRCYENLRSQDARSFTNS